MFHKTWGWKWTTTRNLDTGKRPIQGQSRNSFHVLLICATTQQWSHETPLDLNLCWQKSIVGGWANDSPKFQPQWCFKRLLNNHLITPRTAPKDNLASKHLVPLTASLLCHWLLSKLKTAKVLTVLHLTGVYCLAEATKQPLCQPPALNISLLELCARSGKWCQRKWHHRKTTAL